VAIGPVRQGTVSQEIQDLAAALLQRDREPIQLLESRKRTLTQRVDVLGQLRTRLSALRGAADTLNQPGTLSPFSAKAATSSQTALVAAAAGPTAATGTLSVLVSQLARRATHVSDLFTDDGTSIAGGGTGSYAFTITIAGVDYAGSVDVAADDTDREVLDSVAAAIVAAVGTKGSALRIQTETGRSRLSVASAETGTASKLVFTDTGGLLARLGLVRATPTAATDTTGGYVYEDLGNHELDARLVVDGLTYYRASNTVSDLVSGLTLTLKGVTTTAAEIRVQPDAEAMLGRLTDFIAKYNDVLDHLAQHTFVDPKAGRRGVLALEPVYGDLAGQLRLRMAARVGSQAAGKPDTIGALGLAIGADGKLSIKNETELKDRLAADPGAAATLFGAADGLATVLESYVDGFARASGQIASSQAQLNLRVSGLDRQIERASALLARRQAALELQLAKSQALIQALARQQAFIASITGAA
jgi:flagellar hook-associated protein 2